MGASASILESKSPQIGKESLLSECEDEFCSAASENFLRLTIIENIQLEFQRPTVVLLYGCPYSCIDLVSQFLSKKLKYEIIKCDLGQSLNLENIQFTNPSTSSSTPSCTPSSSIRSSSTSSSSPLSGTGVNTNIRNQGKLFQNYPQTFEQVLLLQSLVKGCQIVVIFLNSSYAVYTYIFFINFIQFYFVTLIILF